jgi:hypothetical protein
VYTYALTLEESKEEEVKKEDKVGARARLTSLTKRLLAPEVLN